MRNVWLKYCAKANNNNTLQYYDNKSQNFYAEG